MASADFSTPIERRRRRPAPMLWRGAKISQGKSLHLPSNADGFTCAMSDWLLGLPVHCRITPSHQPAIRCLFVGSEVCLKAASPPTSSWRSCHRLTVPANRSVEDLHLGDQRHAWHTVVETGLRRPHGVGRVRQDFRPPVSRRTSRGKALACGADYGEPGLLT